MSVESETKPTPVTPVKQSNVKRDFHVKIRYTCLCSVVCNRVRYIKICLSCSEEFHHINTAVFMSWVIFALLVRPDPCSKHYSFQSNLKGTQLVCDLKGVRRYNTPGLPAAHFSVQCIAVNSLDQANRNKPALSLTTIRVPQTTCCFSHCVTDVKQ